MCGFMCLAWSINTSMKTRKRPLEGVKGRGQKNRDDMQAKEE